MNGQNKNIELMISMAPDGNISATGPIHNFEICMDMISTAIKLLLTQRMNDKAQDEARLILPKKRFDI